MTSVKYKRGGFTYEKRKCRKRWDSCRLESSAGVCIHCIQLAVRRRFCVRLHTLDLFFRNTGFYGMLPEVTQSYFCLLMPLVVAAINCFIIYFFMKFAMDFRTFDYGNFLEKYGSRFWGGVLAKPMQIVYELNFNWLLIVCMALAYSTSGSALKELTGIPYIWTTFIVGIIMFLLCMKGTELVRKNAVFMSSVIFIALIVVHVPNLIFNIGSGKLANEMAVMSSSMEAGIASGAGSFFKYLFIAFVWAYIFSGQNLAGFGAYVNHAQLFDNKKTLRWAVVLSVIVNWVFLEMNAINLAGNYSAVYDGWANGKAVYTIMVVQNGWAGGAVRAISLTLLTIAIFLQQSPRRSTMHRALMTVF